MLFLVITFLMSQLGFSQGSCYFSAQVYSQDPCCINIDAGCGDETAWTVVVDGTTYDYTDYNQFGEIQICYQTNGSHTVEFYVFGRLWWTRTVNITGCGGPAIDCTTMGLVDASNTELEISLPTTKRCPNPVARISQRIGNSGPFTPSNFLVDVASNTATISGLAPCEDYQILVELLCDGEVVGGCAQNFSTNCGPAIDCTTMGLVDASNTELEISLPTTDRCPNPIARISQRIGNSGPFTPSNFLVDVASNTATISGLDDCEDYQILVELLCDGEVVGGCVQDFSTTCDVDCDCINFDGIAVFGIRGCQAELVADFNAGDCGQIRINSYNWDFGYPGGTGNTEVVNANFPQNGTYTVTLTMTFTIVATGEVCTVTDQTTITIDDCEDDCCEVEITSITYISNPRNPCQILISRGTRTNGGTECLEGAVTTYDYGDGTSGTSAIHTYNGPGPWIVCVTITKDDCVYEACERFVLTGCGPSSFRSEDADTKAELAEKISIFPNPTSDYVNLAIDQTLNNPPTLVSILDVSGKLVYQQDLTGQSNLAIDLSDAPEGLYIVQLSNQHGMVATERVVKLQ